MKWTYFATWKIMYILNCVPFPYCVFIFYQHKASKHKIKHVIEIWFHFQLVGGRRALLMHFNASSWQLIAEHFHAKGFSLVLFFCIIKFYIYSEWATIFMLLSIQFKGACLTIMLNVCSSCATFLNIMFFLSIIDFLPDTNSQTFFYVCCQPWTCLTLFYLFPFLTFIYKLHK